MISRKSTWLAVLIGILCLAAGTSFPKMREGLQPGAWHTIVENALNSKIIFMSIPLIAVLPMGDLWIKERESGFLGFYIARKGKRDYVADRVITTCYSGVFIWIMAVSIIMLIYFLIFYPLEFKQSLKVKDFANMFWILVRIFLTSGILANLSGAAGILFRSVYMAYGLPFVAYYLMVILQERYLKDIYVINPQAWILGTGDWGIYQLGLWIFLLLLLLLTSLIHGGLLYGTCKEL